MIPNTVISRIRASLCALLCVTVSVQAQAATDALRSGFEDPPNDARPRVWWHWMNGNITKEGIKLDLEWMKRAGLGGFQVFDVAYDTPQVAKKRLLYMTPEWKEAFRYATQIAHRLGLEEAVASSPGWSESGGPSVQPSQAMKKYVWSATEIEGDRRFLGKLIHPPSNPGAFQNLPIDDPGGRVINPASIPDYYADSVVVAYRKPADDIALQSLHPKMSASAGGLDFGLLSDGNLLNRTKLSAPRKTNQTAWIQYVFEKPVTVRAVTWISHDLDPYLQAYLGVGGSLLSLEASNDGKQFRKAIDLSSGTHDILEHAPPECTVSFEPVTARYFRVAFERAPPPALPESAAGVDPGSFGIRAPPPPTGYEISELILDGAARVSHWQEKAAFVPQSDLYSYATPPVDPSHAIARADVIDLTRRMQNDGTLDWTPPPGEWVVLRIGYSLMGITNHPAPVEATGLEVDKLDRKYVRQYLEAYLGAYEKTVGAGLIGKNGIRYVVNDSWEAGSPNWTDDMVAQFKRRRGYDPVPWMPVLTGMVVENADASDRFLWDFRQTIADLVAEEHYGQLEQTLREHQLGHYGESHEVGRQFVADGMEVKRFNEVPMSAMWAQGRGINAVQYGYNADDRESASVAHIYGQNLAAAESFTTVAAPWSWSPVTLKSTADQEFLNGINRLVIHESAHQPLVDKVPGMTLGPFGQWFNRNETWAEYARPWISYLSRASFLLQQGRFAADIVYFYGEDSNLTAIFAHRAPNVPAGYGFDYINADALVHELRVTDGRLTTRSGMSYRVLDLDPRTDHMSLPVLRAIYILVAQGALVVGHKPIHDTSLADNEEEFQKLSDELFGDGTGTHRSGKGTVFAGQSLDDVLRVLDVPPDFDYTKPAANTHLEFVHRRLTNGDIYFIDNRSDRFEAVEASFRVKGRSPELWHPENGNMVPASYRTAGNRTTVPLRLEPWGTIFVVFRKARRETSLTLPSVRETVLESLDQGLWTIKFQPNRGAPPSVRVERLETWTRSSDPGVRYFSGVATYLHTLNANSAWLREGSHIWIDLGDVKNLAEVRVNGKSLGVVWHPPYRVEATRALKPGVNVLSVTVINSWVNRLIGDQQSDVKTPITFTNVHPYRANSPLLDSGLLGPVRVLRLRAGGDS